MSDSQDAVASFTAHPRTFMRANIIDVGSVDINDVTNLVFQPQQQICDLGQAQVVRMGLIKLDNWTIDNKPGGSVYGLYICKNAQAPSFEAFFCPYAQNKMFIEQLSGSASFVFTPRMDGCTFGVSSQSGDGSARVAHANFAQVAVDFGGDSGADRQRTTQLNVVNNRLGYTSMKIEPENYRGALNENLSTTVGRLGSDNKWHFYTLRYRSTGNRRYSHEGLHSEGT